MLTEDSVKTPGLLPNDYIKNTDILHKPYQPLMGNKVFFYVCVGLIRPHI